MEPEITTELLPRYGDREDYEVRVKGPGDTDYKFTLSLSGTVLAIWRIDGKTASESLVSTIINIIGTAGAPSPHYWFDSYNSAADLKETENKIRNFGTELFLRNSTIGDEFRKLLTSSVLENLEVINKKFNDKYGIPLFKSLDYAFEYSQASEDLGNPPKDLANFLYRICILSLIIDFINVRLDSEPRQTGSLQAFKNWLAVKFDANKAEELTVTFQMVKNLRKQYPLHDHYEETADGARIERKEITKAKTHFNLKGDFEGDWQKVKIAFIKAFGEIEKSL
jgi:hypothetical protein